MNQMSRIAAAPPLERFGARFTTAEFLRMVDAGAFDGIKVELVDGELQRMPPPKSGHSLLQTSMLVHLVAAVGVDRARVEIGIDLGDDTVLGADAAVLSMSVTEDRWPRPEEVLLAVEVSESTLARDLGMKQARYAAAGIPTYWVVDGAARVIHCFAEPADGAYRRSDLVRFGEPLTVPGTTHSFTLT